MSDLANYNASAPVVPYGHTTNLGQLITPNQAGYATLNYPGAYPGVGPNPNASAVANMAWDQWQNLVPLNTSAPVIPGNPGVFAPSTQNLMAAGQSQAQQQGLGLNYVLPTAGTQ